MMEEYLMCHDQVSGDSDSSDDSMRNPPSFRLNMSNSAQNKQNDSRAAERAKVLKKHEFTITEELTHGISGRVFLVKNPDEDYFVVKEINYRDNVNFNLDAVKNEINILKKLQHGYIAGYKDSFEESGYFYIVSEYCAGGDLYKKMKTHKIKHLRFEEEQIIDWFVQICLALQYLHKNNVLHRDIKPQNVFLTEDGYINLGDFGCSKVLQSADEYATSVVGAELYSSPEIYEKRHNSKSDIWSLGWLLHDLCMLDVWSDIIERRCLHAISLRGTKPTISNMYSEDLKELISQMLSRDPHERPSADEILAKPFLEDAVERNRRIPDPLKQLLKKHEYTIIEELGQGSSAMIFLVNSAEGEPYVVKEISYKDETNLDEIKEEVEILRSLNHPYIVDYEESFEDQETGHVYIVMEYCAGGDLYQKMQAEGNNGVFEEQQILDWIVQMCLALQHLHEKNILHRDIKPQNVFLTEDGYINLGDFGCSKVLKSADVYGKSVVGSDLYVSPEVLKHKYNFKSDIWSLGWLLHDLCMLNVWSDIIERRFVHALSMTGAPPQISERYSEELRKLIRQMLSCDPNRRPSSAEILAKPFLREVVNRNKRIPVTLKQRFMKTTEIFEENFEDFKGFLNEWKKIIDSLEEIHRKCTIGSLSGSVIGAAGGITALVGAILIPFTFGASIIVSGVGIAVGVAGGATSAASNITNAVQQKALNESIDKISQKYKDVNQQIFSSSDALRLLRKIQKFRRCFGDLVVDNTQDRWWVHKSSFTSWCAAKLFILCLLENRTEVQAVTQTGVQAGPQADAQADAQAGPQAGVQADPQADPQAGPQADAQADPQAGVQAGPQAGPQADAQADAQAGPQAGPQAGLRAGAQAGVHTGVQLGVQTGVLAARAGRAAAAAAEAVVAMAAVSGVLSGLLIIADAVFIAIDSREIHQMRQGEINDPEKVKSSVLKGIAQMRKMHKELQNILEAIKETREALIQNY